MVVTIKGKAEIFLNLDETVGEWFWKHDTQGTMEDDGNGNWEWTLDVDSTDKETNLALESMEDLGLTIKKEV